MRTGGGWQAHSSLVISLLLKLLLVCPGPATITGDTPECSSVPDPVLARKCLAIFFQEVSIPQV